MMRMIRHISGLLAGFLLMILLSLWIPGLFHWEVFYVSSGSMEPAIHVAEAIWVKPCGLEGLKERDIVTYTLNQGTTLVTHRVTAIDQEKEILQTKGDANSEADPVWVRADLVVGKVICHLPYLGYVVALFSSFTGKLFFLGIFLWLTAVQVMAEQWMTPGKRKEKGT